jgi:diaminopimelate decarboxylase
MLHLHLWPDTASIHNGHIHIGGCDLVRLAEEYGTPLYVFDGATLRNTMRTYRHTFAANYPAPQQIHYASKALLNSALARIVAEEGLGLDAVSGTELLIARRAGLPMERVHLHGNAKTLTELERAVDWGVGAIVVDTLDELDQLATLTTGMNRPQGVLLRIAPGIDAHTHAHIATGGNDSKFGLPLGAIGAACERVLAAPGLQLLGLHCHIGSQLFDHTALSRAVGVLVEQAALLRERYGVVCKELSPGGGLGVPYTAEMPASDITAYAAALAGAMQAATSAHHLPLPHLTVEPGRSIVARAGVALYGVVGRKWKDLPISQSPRLQYIHIDGGMADNIRPALYEARYTALLANRADETPSATYHVAGRYCESGDVLLRDTHLPSAAPGDLLAIAVAGAYTLSMASNYNMVPRPAVVLVGEGQARLVVRRETEEDLLAREVVG